MLRHKNRSLIKNNFLSQGRNHGFYTLPNQNFKVQKGIKISNFINKKMKQIMFLASVLLLTFVINEKIVGQELQFANLEKFQLENGEVIAPCKIGYRTYGKLNADKSNVVLAEVWFTGNSSQISVGKGEIFDSTKYFIVIVDPF